MTTCRMGPEKKGEACLPLQALRPRSNDAARISVRYVNERLERPMQECFRVNARNLSNLPLRPGTSFTPTTLQKKMRQGTKPLYTSGKLFAEHG
jgi:hypothetical protein